MRGAETLSLCLLLGGCGATSSAPAPASPTAAVALTSIKLPGAPAEGGVYMDYLAIDRARGKVWVPAGNTGSVDVIDAATGAVQRIEGWPTAEMERRGQKRTVGPSSVTIGDGVVYVGNRGDNTVCAVDASALTRGACVKLEQMPDGIAWVAATREVWVTTPRDQSIHVLDASAKDALTVKARLAFPGEPEGFAVDEQRGIFYTNLEDKDQTLAIDLHTRKVTHTWQPACGEDGPKGLILDGGFNLLVIACANQLVVLDAGHDGQVLSKLDTGDGVDNLDYLESHHEVYAAAGRAATLTVARLDEKGQLARLAQVPTAAGARNGVAADSGAAWITDSKGGAILAVPPIVHR